jgi:hypothetical protein
MVDARVAGFPADGANSLGFLVDEFGFSGPLPSEEFYVGYERGPWSVWAVLDERNKTVDTNVVYEAEGRVSSASVWKLVREAQVLGAGQTRRSALTRAGVQKSLSAQAAALRPLLPLLLAETGKALLNR